jgi:hypothetical protein
MYYFDIIDFLEKNKGEEFTCTEIFMELSKVKIVRRERIVHMLLKLSMTDTRVLRKRVMIDKPGEFTRNPKYPTYVYTWR